ncbi:hypothetical protein BN903_289 [Halorubrum sp. AJ67]|nr:hypothetical protein BN903_289 [Halorubrum sp. AJ67]
MSWISVIGTSVRAYKYPSTRCSLPRRSGVFRPVVPTSSSLSPGARFVPLSTVHTAAPLADSGGSTPARNRVLYRRSSAPLHKR